MVEKEWNDLQSPSTARTEFPAREAKIENVERN